jgi:hypothetical protein
MAAAAILTVSTTELHSKADTNAKADVSPMSTIVVHPLSTQFQLEDSGLANSHQMTSLLQDDDLLMLLVELLAPTAFTAPSTFKEQFDARFEMREVLRLRRVCHAWRSSIDLHVTRAERVLRSTIEPYTNQGPWRCDWKGSSCETEPPPRSRAVAVIQYWALRLLKRKWNERVAIEQIVNPWKAVMEQRLEACSQPDMLGAFRPFDECSSRGPLRRAQEKRQARRGQGCISRRAGHLKKKKEMKETAVKPSVVHEIEKPDNSCVQASEAGPYMAAPFNPGATPLISFGGAVHFGFGPPPVCP